MITNFKNYYDLLLLARLNKPIGIFLLLWPTLTALWFSSGQLPEVKLIVIFTLGTVLMRSAGCIANDIADRNIDAKVKRTKNRPLALGDISLLAAFAFLLILVVISFILVSQLNPFAVFLSFFALISALIYPFSKRFFKIPQFFLGVAFGFGILMTFAVTQNSIPAEGWLLFAANLLWVMGYDSHYALMDVEDDKKLAVYSSAKTLGSLTTFFIIISFIAMYLIYLYIGLKFTYSYAYYASMLLAVFISSYGVLIGCGKKPTNNYKAFIANNYVGFFVFLAFVSQIQ